MQGSWGHRRRQNFGGGKDVCPNFPKLAKIVLFLFGTHFLGRPPKRGLHVFFLETLGSIFEVKGVGRFLLGFSRIFREFGQISQFGQIAQIIDISKFLGFYLHHCTSSFHTTGGIPFSLDVVDFNAQDVASDK